MILTDGTTTINLPNDIIWVDELSWSSVEQSADYSLTGALVIESWQRQAGRKITLKSPADQAVLPRSTINILRTWWNTPEKTMSLTIRGVTRTVVFNYGGVFEPDVIGFWCDPIPDSALYFVTIPLMEL
jgi:hypothetical protein